ncbi:MAG TPA: DUF58 domain-containing protein [Albitalea sp.]|nr:DUF58 domain-containing protein [Albitalea sp.]
MNLAAVSPVRFVRGRFRAWWQARLRRTDSVLLTQRNIYILPTKAGLLFAITLLTLLVASINYQLNLGYVLTFLLAGSGAVSIHLTHNTLRGLTLRIKPVAPVFAGDAATLEVVLASPAGARRGIGLKVESAAAATLTWVDVPAGGQASAHVSFVPQRRGRHHVPTLSAETRFPLGLFRAWTIWQPAGQVLVYPKPERPAAPLPPARAVPGGPTRIHWPQGGEMEGIRAYRRGDPLKMVYWKKAAKAMEAGGELVSRDTSASAQHELWLDWQACGPLAPEDRLSRLAAWILSAERAGIDHGLRLPGVELPRGHGEAHRRAGLEALALWS